MIGSEKSNPVARTENEIVEAETFFIPLDNQG